MAIIPTTDVNLATEVRDVLNAAGGSVTNDTTTFFSSEAKLNMWSKYKPVVDPQLFHTLDEWLGQNGWSGAYRGFDNKCGLTINTYGTVETLRVGLEDGTAMWSYTPPQGGTDQPMRLGDFRGYNTDAVNPIGDFVTDGYAENGTSNVFGDVTFSVDVVTGLENNLEYSDILINDTPLTEFYLGLYFTNGTIWRYKTNDTPLGDAYDFTITIPMTTGTWKCIPFFSSVVQDNITGSGNAGTLLSANIVGKTFTIIGSGDKVVFTVFGIWNSTKTKVENIQVSVENNSGSSVTLTKLAVEVRAYNASGVDENVGSPSTSYYLGSSSSTLSVANGATVTTQTGDFNSITVNKENYDGFFLNAYGYVGDTLYRHTYEIEEIVDEA